MDINIFHIDAFVSESCKGSTACIIPLNNWLSDETLLQISLKNSVAETAFVIIKKNKILLRWFTPEIEMDLCGHATLAAAHCLLTHLGYSKKKISFKTLSGLLDVNFSKGLYHMDLPARKGKLAALPSNISEALSMAPKEVYKARDYLLSLIHI